MNELLIKPELIRNAHLDPAAGIELLCRLHCAQVSLCDKWGNARAEEGSEHYLGTLIE